MELKAQGLFMARSLSYEVRVFARPSACAGLSPVADSASKDVCHQYSVKQLLPRRHAAGRAFALHVGCTPDVTVSGQPCPPLLALNCFSSAKSACEPCRPVQGVEFEKHDVEIKDEFRKMYDAAVDLWAAIDVALTGAREDGALQGKGFQSVRTQQFGADTLEPCSQSERIGRRTLVSRMPRSFDWEQQRTSLPCVFAC